MRFLEKDVRRKRKGGKQKRRHEFKRALLSPYRRRDASAQTGPIFGGGR